MQYVLKWVWDFGGTYETYNGRPQCSIIRTSSWRWTDDMEPSFFAFADAQQTLVDCTAPVVADGGDNGGHSPAIKMS